MLYNFVSIRSAPLAKRRKVRRACDFCRQHRVRCDGRLPCGQCLTNKVECKKPSQHSYSHPHPNPHPLPSTSGNRELQPSAPSSFPHPQPAPPSAPNQAVVSQQVRPRLSSPRTPSIHHAGVAPLSQHLDSFAGFISRVNSFCTVVSQMSTQPSPHPPIESAPADVPCSSRDLLRRGEPILSQLTPNSLNELQATLFDIFWTRYYFLMPIVSSEDLANKSDGQSEPLRQALMAYCLQSIYHAGLHNRLLSIQKGMASSDHGENPSQSPLVAKLFVTLFQQALATNNTYLLYAEPSLADVQRHLLMAAFLLNSGEPQAAYNILGVAMRLTQSLDLQRLPRTHLPPQEAEARQRIWWKLVHLDFHCSRLLGKPMAVSLNDKTITMPHPTPESSVAAPDLTYYSASISLTVAARQVAESLENHLHAVSGTVDSVTKIERYAHHLSREIKHLYEWKDRILNAKLFPNMTLACGAYQPEAMTATEDGLKHDHDARLSFHLAPAVILQRTLLELQYHDIVLWVHHSFIQFPSRGLVPQRSPQADVHATTAIQHALTVTDLIRLRMLYHDVLYGSSEIYQYLWNAVLTLIGFMLAYPLCYWFPRAQQHVERSLQIFEAAGPANPIASRAAHLTRYLLGRVSALMELLSSQSSAPNDRTDGRGVQALDPVEPEKKQQQQQPPLFTSEDDALWSCADIVDPNIWYGYCHEINDMLMDVPEISLGTDFFTS
ncbi:fungal-specific transcription factor domain-containing protein [Aspergillus parasiticus]|uniref:Fungal-specific transcription factor domain-containing protein n=1 Tax=Aspergillus parasiticus TaxID=5067 RepID=A0A5N6D7X1_ASPPA|nr:fungal-specific transcription factor domain-containing protein [Aspergillus parasiticus]